MTLGFWALCNMEAVYHLSGRELDYYMQRSFSQNFQLMERHILGCRNQVERMGTFLWNIIRKLVEFKEIEGAWNHFVAGIQSIWWRSSWMCWLAALAGLCYWRIFIFTFLLKRINHEFVFYPIKNFDNRDIVWADLKVTYSIYISYSYSFEK